MKRAVVAAVVAAVALFLGSPAVLTAAESGSPSKISRDLAALAAGQPARTAAAPAAGGWVLRTDALLPVSGDWVAINAVAAGDPAALAADLTGLGARDVAVAGRIVSARFPIRTIPSLAALTSLRFARPAYRRRHVGAVTSGGDGAMRSDVARPKFGLDGNGVTVGVLSDSFGCIPFGPENDVLTGDLPAGVNVVVPEVCSSGTDEGRAMLQIVHDIAPGANLAFATAEPGQANFANNIRALRDAGANVIVDDAFYLDEPMFQDGVIAQAVDEVVASGVSYFSAAGNDARHAYEQPFLPGTFPPNLDLSSFLFLGGTPHKFGSTILQAISSPGQSVFGLVLQWDAPFASVSGPPGAENALDVYVVAPDPDRPGVLFIVEAIPSESLTSGDPVTAFALGCPAPVGVRCTGFLMLVNREGPNPGRFKYILFPLGGPLPTLSPALNAGTIYGHSNAAGAVAVGAAFYKTPLTLEPFSSGGTTRVVLDTNGNPLPLPDLRLLKPEIVAPDGVDTTFFGGPGDPELNGFFNFFGTSAAAPHAAGVAALMLQGVPTLTPDELRTTLQQTAINIGAAGFDTNSGFGLIQADRALVALHELTIMAGPTATPSSVVSGGTVSLSVTATDNFGHTLTYAWTAVCTGLPSNGAFDNATVPAPAWTAPPNTTGLAKTCAIAVTVSDGQGFTRTASLTETVRSVPKITTLTPLSGPVGTLVTITGLSLGAVTDVTFSLDQTVPATTVTAISVKALVPEGAQTGPVRLTSPDGIGTSPGVFKVTPKIAGFTPASGVTGESVTINGFNLQVGSVMPTVKFGTGAATVTAATPTSVTATILATSLSGRISVTTTDGTGTSGTDFVVIKPPTITAFTPASAPAGATVTITGTNLSSVTGVAFNGTNVSGIIVISATSIQVTVPAGATTGTISAVNRAGIALSAVPFKVSPRIDGVSPTTTVAGTDTVITITGVNLQAATGTPAVKVGTFAIPAASVLLAMDTQIQIKVPLGAVTGKVSVMTVDGTGTSAATLTVLQPPKVTTVTPLLATVGTTLAITGMNLTGATGVTFTGGQTAIPTLVTATSLRVVVPAGAQTGPIIVTNPTGSGTGPTLKLAPKITGFAPPSAIAGEIVTISGFNLKVAAVDPTVKIGAVATVVTAGATDTSVTVTVPPTAVTGKISVMTTDGTGTSAADFIVIRPPTITAFTPLSGPVGTAVTITGTNLNSVTDVTFNLTSAPGFTILSATSIRATVPAGATTGKISLGNRAGIGQSAASFKVAPTITGFSPDSVVAGRVEFVTVTGMNLTAATGAPIVKIGTMIVPAPIVPTPTASIIVFPVPPTAVTGKISVTTIDGTATSTATLTVIQPPKPASFTPAAAPVGALITVNGTNLAGTSTVIFTGSGPVTVTPTAVLATSLKAIVPLGAVTGPIAVTNPAGVATSTAIFKVQPKITGFTPPSVPAGGNTSVVVTGTNLRALTGATTVKVGALAIPSGLVLANSSTTVEFLVPASAVTGQISVTTLDGVALSATNLLVIKPPKPTGVTPAAAPVGGEVTITGTGLTGTSHVGFFGLPGFTDPTFPIDGFIGAQITSVSETAVRAIVPAGAGFGQIVVANAAGAVPLVKLFTVLPRITGFAPPSGAAGDGITISGFNLTDSGLVAPGQPPGVKIGTVTAEVVGSSPTEVAFIIPTTASTAKVSVQTNVGTATSADALVVTTPPVPDLAVVGVTAAAVAVASSATTTRSIPVVTSVRNLGPAASPPSSLAVLLAPAAGGSTTRAIARATIPAIAPGGVTNVATSASLPLDLASGQYVVGVALDPDGTLVELDELNNRGQADTELAVVPSVGGTYPLLGQLSLLCGGPLPGEEGTPLSGPLTLTLTQAGTSLSGTLAGLKTSDPAQLAGSGVLTAQLDSNGLIDGTIKLSLTANSVFSNTTLGFSAFFADGVVDQVSFGESLGSCSTTVFAEGAPATTVKLGFVTRAQPGAFGADAPAPMLTGPLAPSEWGARLAVTFETALPLEEDVRFTGPAGSGLADAPATVSFLSNSTHTARLDSPPVTSPPFPPGGTWQVVYKTPRAFTVPPPQGATRLVFPVPVMTFTQADPDLLARITWSYRTGANVSVAPPMFLRSLRVVLHDADGLPSLDSGLLPPATVALGIFDEVRWSCVSRVVISYVDDLGNTYEVGYPHPVNACLTGFGPSLRFVFDFPDGSIPGAPLGLTNGIADGALDFPAPLASYTPRFMSRNVGGPASVFFSGPADSSLSHTESVVRVAGVPGTLADIYDGPRIGPNVGPDGIVGPAAPPGGTYRITDADGADVDGSPVTLDDPDTEARAIIVVPRVFIAGGMLTRVGWAFALPNGFVTGPPPTDTLNIAVEGVDPVTSAPVRLYSGSFALAFGSLTDIVPAVRWQDVRRLTFQYMDDLRNFYTSSWSVGE